MPLFKKPLDTYAKALKLFVMDCDGVLTDGRVLMNGAGGESAHFSIRDEGGIQLLKKHGIVPLVLSGRHSDYVRGFCQKNDIRGHAPVDDKKTFLLELIVRDFPGTSLEEIAYIGDGIADVEIMRCVGLPIAVADAVREVHECAIMTTEAKGGAHAVREACDAICAARDRLLTR